MRFLYSNIRESSRVTHALYIITASFVCVSLAFNLFFCHLCNSLHPTENSESVHENKPRLIYIKIVHLLNPQ